MIYIDSREQQKHKSFSNYIILTSPRASESLTTFHFRISRVHEQHPREGLVMSAENIIFYQKDFDPFSSHLTEKLNTSMVSNLIPIKAMRLRVENNFCFPIILSAVNKERLLLAAFRRLKLFYINLVNQKFCLNLSHLSGALFP